MGGKRKSGRRRRRRRRHRRRQRGGSGNARLRCTVLELVAGEHLIRRGVDVIVYAASDVYRLEAREKGNRLRGSYSPLIRRGRASHGSENLVRLGSCR